ncbi:NAD(P)/FAD-dependent oxidoreductase [Peribacillus alkalitolerans]|uniref:NAD(P)/FAD-dependent oxidoreductase n=1 Tax=Peribacillus alkalitolerans TaxID=1550385 RepID=UPI0013D31698|nr:FAD-binding oxidoreductase [Peribacillus alkalitolerans]
MKSFIVVGAGILGASTAYHLAKNGAKVTLVDRKDKGQATDAAAGIICPWVSQRRNKAWYQLAKGGAKYYPTLIKELESVGESDTGYDQVGAICLHSEEEKLDKLEERANKRRDDAPEIGEITRLSASETQALFPPLSDRYSSVHISGAGRVNGRAVRTSLIRVAINYGVHLINGDAKLVFTNNIVNGIEVNGKIVEADQVIVTAGAWSKELLEPLGISFLVTPQKAQIIHLGLPGFETSKWPVVMPPNDQYLLSFEDGRVVVGATHENDVGFDHRVTAGGVLEVLKKALAIAPGLANGTLLETRVGYRPFTPGFLPVIGELPNFKGILVANGLGASGLTCGPYVGAELAKLVLGHSTEININNYDVKEAISTK